MLDPLQQMPGLNSYIPSISAIVLTKLRNYEPEKHRTMAGPIDRSADEYDFICAELDHTDRKVIEIVTRKHEPLALAESPTEARKLGGVETERLQRTPTWDTPGSSVGADGGLR
jgi:hypothetical protein